MLEAEELNRLQQFALDLGVRPRRRQPRLCREHQRVEHGQLPDHWQKLRKPKSEIISGGQSEGERELTDVFWRDKAQQPLVRPELARESVELHGPRRARNFARQ